MSMAKMVLDLEKYTQCARKTAAEGQVLLRNEKGVLPIPAGWQFSGEYSPTIIRAAQVQEEW